MEKTLLVGLGGFIGAIARYALGGMLLRSRTDPAFPLETLVVNVLGCLAIGILGGLAENRGLFSDATRTFLLVGLLGGFTTFSSFGYETFELLRDGLWSTACASVGLQTVLGIGAVWAGHVVARTIGG